MLIEVLLTVEILSFSFIPPCLKTRGSIEQSGLGTSFFLLKMLCNVKLEKPGFRHSFLELSSL